jgi:predicted amidophosphoribosyltransferase
VNLSLPFRTHQLMICQSCYRPTRTRLLCEPCRIQMRSASDRLIGGGVRLVSAFEHSGPARDLVHNLKYRGLTNYLELVTAVLTDRLPVLPFVPIPRSISRQVRYGVDPALILARRLAQAKGTRVVRSLVPHPHSIRRAGGDHAKLVVPYRVRSLPKGPVIVVDDVFTTGATLDAAVRSLGPNRVQSAVVANVVPEVSSLLRPSTAKPTTQV